MAVQPKTIDDVLHKSTIKVPEIDTSRWVQVSNHAQDRARERLGLNAMNKMTLIDLLIDTFRKGTVVVAEDGHKCMNTKYEGKKVYMPFADNVDYYYLISIAPGYASSNIYSRFILK